MAGVTTPEAEINRLTDRINLICPDKVQVNTVTRRQDILTLLQRRPCSIEDIAAGLGLHQNKVVKYVEELSSEGKIEAKPQNQRIYYKATI